MARLEFVSFHLGDPPFDVKECQQRGLTYASPLRAKVRLVIMDREASKPTVKEVKEQEVYMGEIPLMTTTGSFVINGTERVIVSQLHRSPGVFFEHDRGKTHSSGKLLFSARVIPYRGSWLDFEFDPKDILYFRVDRRRKMPATILLKAIGLIPEQILAHFFPSTRFALSAEPAASWSLCPSACAAKSRASTSSTRPARSWSRKDKRINAKHIRDMEAAGMKRIEVPEDYLLGRVLAAQRRRSAKPAKSWRNANEELTEDADEASARGQHQRRSARSTSTISTRARSSPTRCVSTKRRPARRAHRHLPDDASGRAARPKTRSKRCSAACSSTRTRTTCRASAA